MGIFEEEAVWEKLGAGPKPCNGEASSGDRNRNPGIPFRKSSPDRYVLEFLISIKTSSLYGLREEY